MNFFLRKVDKILQKFIELRINAFVVTYKEQFRRISKGQR